MSYQSYNNDNTNKCCPLKRKSEVRIHQCIRSPAILHTTYKESSQCQELLATNEPGFFKMMGSTNI